MAKYLILIYGSEQRWENLSAAEKQQIDGGHEAFRTKAGTAMLAAGQLELSGAATTLRDLDNGVPIVADGPYAEAKEGLGGFYLIDVPDLDQAIALTGVLAEVAHEHSAVEIRPLVDHG